MKRGYFIILAVILLVSLVPLLVFAELQGSPIQRQYGKGYPFQIGDLPPGHLRSALESLPPQAKARAIENLHSFSFPHRDIEHLWADKNGGIFYICNIEVDDALVAEAETEVVAPMLSFDPSKAFLLHSHPGAPNKVFLNFQGGIISGTAWSSTTLNAVPYDTDGNPAVFSDAERRIIADIWHRVAEDYAPFDIDVTTERPASFGPKVGHVMITKDTDANGAAMPAKGAGGVAYVGVWGYSNYASTYQPAFVYFNNLATTVVHYISEAASHEFGHNLSLSHDGTSTTGYYSGLGSGNVSWGPIMGVGYYTQVTQWSKGEYPDANNTQDDVAIVAGKLPYRLDDHGGSMATAAELVVDPDGTIWSSNPENDPDNIYPENKGVIERASDVDFFSFDHAGGVLSLTITPAWEAFYASKRGANLDIEATLYDSSGNVLAVSDPVTDTNASISVAAAGAGRYYLAVTGVGNSVTPYSDYGSLGQYFINGTVTTTALKADFTYTTSGLTANFADASTDSGGTINSWSWTFGDGGTSFAQNPSHTYADSGSYTITLTVTDNMGRSTNTSRVVTVTKPNVEPNADFTFSVSGLTANFTDVSTDSDGTIASRSWNFGDGGSSASQNPSHTYASGGDYTVTLTVTDNSVAPDSVQHVISLTGPPTAPSNLTASVVTTGGKTRTKTVTLNWKDNSSNENGFTIQRCTETGKGAIKTCNYSDLATVGANITTFTNTPGSGTFRYRVRGFNSSGLSAYSNEVRI